MNVSIDSESVKSGPKSSSDVNQHKKVLQKKGSNKLSGFKKVQEDFLKSITSRLTVAQVVSGVKHSSEVTFDFVMYTFFAGCIAAAGILASSNLDIAAAMCIGTS